MPISGNRYGFTEKNIDDAPDDHGVYALYHDEELIYIGRAAGKDVTIRSRLRDHLSGREGKGTQQATSYAREITSAPAPREEELLNEYRQQHHKLPRYNEKIA